MSYLAHQQKARIYTYASNPRKKDDIIKILFNEVFHFQSFKLTNKTNTTLALTWTFFYFLDLLKLGSSLQGAAVH